MKRWRSALGLVAALAGGPAAAQPGSQPVWVGDTIPAPLAASLGDAARGRAIVASRQTGLCLLCHRAPIAEERFQGDLAPDLAGVGHRFSAAQLRGRIVDARRANPQTIMPPMFVVDGLQRVGSAWHGKPALDAQQVEDVLAYLLTLRD